VRRGEIWIANLNPDRGAEPGKRRPVLILQADELIRSSLDTVVVLPLTTRIKTDRQPLRPILAARAALQSESQVLVDQPRSLDRGKFGAGPVAVVSGLEMAAIERSLRAVLGMAHG
jgi:mRNA interferase MazF